MKKQLLLGSALLAAVTSYSQNTRVKPTGTVKAIDRIAMKFLPNEESTTSMSKAPELPAEAVNPGSGVDPVMLAANSGTWTLLSGSRNVYGVLVSHQKPLNYNHNVNAISFVHRVSSTYVTSPDNSGSMVAMISTNWGSTWDSTAIWAHASNLARYPQGGVYSPPGNTNINNAYVVGTGPVTGGSGWIGNWYASKKLGSGTYNNVPDNTPNAQQFFSSSAPTGSVLAHEFSRYSFTSTDDGLVRSMATIGDTSFYMMTGSFNAGVFNWSGTVFTPPVVQESSGDFQLLGYPYMAWNQAGTVGYMVAIGARNGVTVTENKGYQPIVYKTTNSGASWSLLTGIDFTAGSFTAVTYPLAPIKTNPNKAIPFFNFQEGIDVTVDANDKLHIVSTVVGTSSEHPDTLGYIYSFPNADGESYRFPHVPGSRPYIYDFVTDGTGWSFRTIDSLSSEVPASSASGNGYNFNPWDPDPANSNSKVSSSSRIQLSRTPDGTQIIYSWAESDTNFTTNQVKWNIIPDIKARTWSLNNNTVSNEVNVSKLGGSSNVGVSARSMFHYMSPVSGSYAGGQVKVPFTVTNSNPYSQLTSNKHWYITANLNVIITGVNESNSLASTTSIYPNPANGNAVVSVVLTENTPVNVTVYNTIGQMVSNVKAQGQLGQNEINLDLNNLTPGVYMITVKAANGSVTKKLVVE